MNYSQPLVADIKGQIYELPLFDAVGMKGGLFYQLRPSDLIPLPFGAQLLFLPQRVPVVYDQDVGTVRTLDKNPLTDEPCFAVAAFNPPGWTITHNAAYTALGGALPLPLYAYAPVVWFKKSFYTTAVRVDREKRQDIRSMNISVLPRKIQAISKKMAGNRLVTHLKRCAQKYHCPAAINFFLGRYEAPLPTSRSCNARCLGCLSLQPSGCCPATQPRITFSPTPAEVADIALYHIGSYRKRIVSFGQGCEGEPLLNPDVLIKSIERIRRKKRGGPLI